MRPMLNKKSDDFVLRWVFGRAIASWMVEERVYNIEYAVEFYLVNYNGKDDFIGFITSNLTHDNLWALLKYSLAERENLPDGKLFVVDEVKV